MCLNISNILLEERSNPLITACFQIWGNRLQTKLFQTKDDLKYVPLFSDFKHAVYDMKVYLCLLL